jgi:hypothetical protein
VGFPEIFSVRCVLIALNPEGRKIRAGLPIPLTQPGAILAGFHHSGARTMTSFPMDPMARIGERALPSWQGVASGEALGMAHDECCVNLMSVR